MSTTVCSFSLSKLLPDAVQALKNRIGIVGIYGTLTREWIFVGYLFDIYWNLLLDNIY
jgi:hypothetical protein